VATTREQNERLTRVGPGTPMGSLLRRYWQPIGTVAELADEPVQRVRVMGEDLTLFRTEKGEYGLVDERCPHRCMSMEYGIPQEDGLRCAYHGWLFAPSGQCLEQPYEETERPEAHFKDKVRIKAYPTQELGGLIFGYLGPEPAPLLPRWDVLVRDDLDAVIDVHQLPCNWLQCMDNSVDPIHFEHLHAAFGNYQLKKQGKPPAMKPARHLKIAFDPFRYGIYKRRLLEGEPESIDDWQIGHPLLFPNILAVGEADWPMLHYRVPIDDETTLQFMYRTNKRQSGAAKRPVAVRRSSIYNEQGQIVADHIPPQDMLAFVAQGRIADRSREHLGASDVGVILYHKMLFEEMDKVQRGEDPLGLIRDRAENEPMVNLRREQQGYDAFDSKYNDYFENVEQLATSRAG
jgi:5,5'-dehydrodivanillate O-demethylase oxygenase subunit